MNGVYMSETVQRVTHPVRTSLIMSLSQQHAALTLASLGNTTQRILGTMFPSAVFLRDTLELFSRTRTLHKNFREESFLLHQQYDRRLERVGVDRIVAVDTAPSPFLGPEDPRAFIGPYGRLFVVFKMHVDYNRCRIHVHDVYASVTYLLEVDRLVLLPWEKNWAPFVKNNTIHFVYSFEPLRVIRCETLPHCTLVFGVDDDTSGRQEIHTLRGGSPWLALDPSERYYMSLAHTTDRRGSTMALLGYPLHRAMLVLLRTAPTFEIIYVGGPLEVSRDLMANELHASTQVLRVNPVIDPCGITRLDTLDAFYVSISFDSGGALIATCGLMAIAEDVVRRYDAATTVPSLLRASGRIEESIFALLDDYIKRYR